MKQFILLLITALFFTFCSKKTATKESDETQEPVEESITPITQQEDLEPTASIDDTNTSETEREKRIEGTVKFFDDLSTFVNLNIENKNIKRTEIEKSDFDYSIEYKQANFLEQSNPKIEKINNKITIPLQNKDTIFIDNSEEEYNDVMTNFKYEGYASFLDKYFLSVHLWEGFSWFTIDRKTGKITAIGQDIYFNDTHTKMFAYDYDPYDDEVKLYIYKVENKDLIPIYTESQNSICPEKVYWKNNHIFIEASYPYDDEKENSFYMITL